MSNRSTEYIVELERTLEQRKAAATSDSYTARLYAAGRSKIAQKVGEEAVELAIAGVQDDRKRIVAEAADLVYHLLVLLRSHDISFSDVVEELRHRQR
jgi:phosphoribosyl-ATP pyrophosphohydrolase